MEEKLISFFISSETKSIPIYKSLFNEGLIIMDSITITNLKGLTAPQFIMKSTSKSIEKLEPLFLKTDIVGRSDKLPLQKFDTLIACFPNNITIDCGKMELELVIANLESMESESLLYATIQYKTFIGDNDEEIILHL